MANISEVTLEIFKNSKKITSDFDDDYIINCLIVSDAILSPIIEPNTYTNLTDNGKVLYNQLKFLYTSHMYDNREIVTKKEETQIFGLNHMELLLSLEANKTNTVED